MLGRKPTLLNFLGSPAWATATLTIPWDAPPFHFYGMSWSPIKCVFHGPIPLVKLLESPDIPWSVGQILETNGVKSKYKTFLSNRKLLRSVVFRPKQVSSYLNNTLKRLELLWELLKKLKNYCDSPWKFIIFIHQKGI